MPPTQHDIDAIYNLIRSMEQRNGNRHTEVVRELATLKATQPKQPCRDVREVADLVKAHLKNHDESGVLWKREIVRVLVTAILAAIAALTGVNLQSGDSKPTKPALTQPSPLSLPVPGSP